MKNIIMTNESGLRLLAHAIEYGTQHCIAFDLSEKRIGQYIGHILRLAAKLHSPLDFARNLQNEDIIWLALNYYNNGNEFLRQNTYRKNLLLRIAAEYNELIEMKY